MSRAANAACRAAAVRLRVPPRTTRKTWNLCPPDLNGYRGRNDCPIRESRDAPGQLQRLQVTRRWSHGHERPDIRLRQVHLPLQRFLLAKSKASSNALFDAPLFARIYTEKGERIAKLAHMVRTGSDHHTPAIAVQGSVEFRRLARRKHIQRKPACFPGDRKPLPPRWLPRGGALLPPDGPHTSRDRQRARYTAAFARQSATGSKPFPRQPPERGLPARVRELALRPLRREFRNGLLPGTAPGRRSSRHCHRIRREAWLIRFKYPFAAKSNL